MITKQLFFRIDLIRAIKNYDLQGISEVLLAMAEAGSSLSPYIMKKLAKVLSSDRLPSKSGPKDRRSYHLLVENPKDKVARDVARDYCFLCKPANQELAKHITYGSLITLPCRLITEFDKKMYRRNAYPSRTEIKMKLCELYNVSPRSFDTYIADNKTNTAFRIRFTRLLRKDDKKMWLRHLEKQKAQALDFRKGLCLRPLQDVKEK